MNGMSSVWFWMDAGSNNGFSSSYEIYCAPQFTVAQAYLTETSGGGLQGVYIDHYDYLNAGGSLTTVQVHQNSHSDPCIYADQVMRIVFLGTAGASQGLMALCNAFFW